MRPLAVCLCAAAWSIAAAAPSITAADPNPIDAGGPYFPLTITGSGFMNGSIAHWGPVTLSTTYLGPTQLSAAITPDLRLIAGNYNLTVTNPDTTVSNPYPITVLPVIGPVSPTAAVAGSQPVTITVKGIGFQSRVVARISSASGPVTLPTSIVDSATLTAVIPSSALADARSATIQIVDVPSGGASATTPFFIRAVPAITSLSPNPVDAGGGYFLLTISGSGFSPGLVVNWPDGSTLAANSQSSTQLQVPITPELRVLAGSFPLTVTDPTTGAVSNPYAVTVAPVLFGISPSAAPTGGAPMTITASGTGFTSSTQLAMTLAGRQSTLPTALVDSKTLTAVIPSDAFRASGDLLIQVIDAAGGGHSQMQTIKVAPGIPSLASLSPNGVSAGANAFTLTVAGSNFTNGASVLWNGAALASTFVSATQLTAAVPASLVQSAAGVSITVANAGGSPSAAVTFTIHPPPPALSAISPVSATAGSPAFTLAITAANCAAGCVAQWNGTPLTTTVVSATALTAAVPANFIVSPATAVIRLVNSEGAGSNSANFAINPAAATLTAVSPTSLTPGPAAVTLTLAGRNFAAGSIVLWSGTPLATSFVSATQLTASVPTALLIGLSATVTVSSPGGAVSNGLPIAINAPQPSIASLAPSSIAAGAGSFSLNVSGQNFAVNCVVRWNGVPLFTTLVSGTQATANVPADLVSAAGSLLITIANPSGLESAPASFTISTATPSIVSISPASAAAGSPAITLTIAGTNFAPQSIVRWNGTPLPTTFVSSSQLRADVAAALLAIQGFAAIDIAHSGAAPSSAVGFTVGVPVPAVTPAGIVNAASGLPDIAPGSLISIYGASLAPGDAASASIPLPLSLNGSSVTIDGIPAPLVFVSAGQINAQVPYEIGPGQSKLIVRQGTLNSPPVTVTIRDIAPGVLPVIQNAADGTVNSPQSPAHPGDYITLWLTGQGPLDTPIATGAPSPSDPIAMPLATVAAQIAGIDTQVAFAGMGPGLPGLLQINLIVPEVPTGGQPLVITVGGVQSNAVTVSVAPKGLDRSNVLGAAAADQSRARQQAAAK